MVPKTLITDGPNIAVPKPTPVGWELDPVTEGIFNEDKIKIKAPDKANMVFEFGSFETIFLILIKPKMKNGKNSKNHTIHHTKGR